MFGKTGDDATQQLLCVLHAVGGYAYAASQFSYIYSIIRQNKLSFQVFDVYDLVRVIF